MPKLNRLRELAVLFARIIHLLAWKFFGVLKKPLGVLFLFHEGLKGEKTVYEVKLPKNALGHLVGFAVSGYEVRIYCQKKQYERKYKNWFVPDKRMVLYRVFSVVTNDAPERLKEACELDIDIPCQLSSFVDDEGQKDAAILAYLDILAHRLEEMPDKTPA